MKTFLLISFVLLVAFGSMISGTGCANIVPPQGGPRDTLPPVLLNVDPPDSTLNFRGNRITFTFDEYVNL
ncbi:MAG: Ig-like domain-containing protein, partial [Chitinophagaceae bacterium]